MRILPPANCFRYCGQITFTETSDMSVFFWVFTWNEPVVAGSALVVGILCRIAKNGLDIELFDGNIKHYWYKKCCTNQINNATNAKDSISRRKGRRNTHKRDVRKVVHTTINIIICLTNIPCRKIRWKSHLLHWF